MGSQEPETILDFGLWNSDFRSCPLAFRGVRILRISKKSDALRPSDQFNDSGMAGSRGQSPVTSENRGGQRLRQSDIHSVISRHVVPEFPNAGQEKIVWISVDRKVREIFQCLSPTFGYHLSGSAIAKQNLRNFQIKKVGHV